MMLEKQFAVVIEDDADIGVIFSEALKAANFETEWIYSGEIALERLRERKPNLIVLDLHLPIVSGAEILHEIRRDALLAEVPVIMATADPRMADVLGEIADVVLIKPVSYRQLRDIAQRFFAAHTRV